MFNDINQMEKEIEVFRKNMLASSELINEIAKLTEMTKQQKEEMATSTDALIQKTDSCIKQFRDDHEEALQRLSRNNDATINSLQQKMISEQDKRLAELSQIKDELNSQKRDFEKRLQTNEQELQKYQSSAEQKYKDFVCKLETTNVDQIYKELQQMKQLSKTRFIIILGGLVLSIVATVLFMIVD